MKIKLTDIGKIRPYEGNPRIADDAAIDGVAESLRQFGFRQPIVVDGDMVIVAGHTRYEAAKRMGLKKVPVHVAEDLTPEQVRAYRLADNRTSELSMWDYDLLPVEQDVDFMECPECGHRFPK